MFDFINDTAMSGHNDGYKLGYAVGFEEFKMIVEAYAKNKNNKELMEFISTINREGAKL